MATTQNNLIRGYPVEKNYKRISERDKKFLAGKVHTTIDYKFDRSANTKLNENSTVDDIEFFLTRYIRYHDTDVVEFSRNHIVLDSGGYWTATTKRRMNQAADYFGLSFKIRQSAGVWYVDCSSSKYANRISFKDSDNKVSFNSN